MKLMQPKTIAALLAPLALAAWGSTSFAGEPQAPVGKYVDSLMPDQVNSQTKIRMITDNVEAWLARWHLIQSAQKSIDMTYFVFDNDIFGRCLLGLLRNKAREGVKVRMMVDAFGGRQIVGDGKAGLKAVASLPHAEVRKFNPKIKWPQRLVPSIKAVVAANHDKILLIDGAKAITGGRNIGWHYMASAEDKHHVFRDTDIVMEGKDIAVQMKKAFEDEWDRRQTFDIRGERVQDEAGASIEIQLAYQAMRKFLLGYKLEIPDNFSHATLLGKIHAELHEFPAMKGKLGSFRKTLWVGERPYPTRILDKDSLFGDSDEIKKSLIKMLDKAEKSIWIQNPYVVLRKDIAAAMKRAAYRGVPIHLLTNGPASTNQMLTQAYFLKDWKTMMLDMPTLRIYAMKKGHPLHAKTFVIDDQVASIGSYNLDPLSTDINSEIIALVNSATFSRRLRHRLEQDVEQSVEYKIEVLEDGEVKVIRGPEQEVSRKANFFLRLIRNIPYLRNVI